MIQRLGLAGRIVLTGLPHEPTPVSFFSVVRREVTLTGSMIYQDEFPEALELVTSGAVKTGPLITHRFALDRIDEAFAAHARLPERCRVTAPGQPNDVLEGVALGLDPDGALLLRDDAQRVHRVVSGELLT